MDQLWTEDRPALPSGMAFAYPEDYAGLSVRKKLQLVREKMEKLRLDYYVVGALDSLCWLYNLRGSDVDTSPLFTGFAMIDHYHRQCHYWVFDYMRPFRLWLP